MTPLEELTDSFHRGANKVFELAQLLQISLDKIQSIISKVTDPQAKVKLYDDECDIIQAQLSSYDESFAAAKNFITTYTKKLDTVLSVLSPTIRWLPEKQTMMEMTYQEGSSPWSFTLIHTGVNKTSISSLLEEHFTKGMLQSLPNLCAGDFVCCFERKMLYRAVVLGLMPNDRVKVLNVDNNHKKIVRKENIYDLTVDLLDIPAQCMHCCLMTLDANEQKLWSEELNHIFKATLSECKLSVNVIDRIESLPPKFIVEVYGFNEALESEANLSEWICHRVLPEVKQIAEKSDTDDVVSMMREDALDPFYGSTSEESDHILLKAVSEVSHHQSKGEQTEGESTIQKGSADSSKENPEKEKWYKDESLDLSERYPLYFDRDIHQKGEPNFVTNPLNPIVEFNPKNIELQHVKSKHADEITMQGCSMFRNNPSESLRKHFNETERCSEVIHYRKLIRTGDTEHKKGIQSDRECRKLFYINNYEQRVQNYRRLIGIENIYKTKMITECHTEKKMIENVMKELKICKRKSILSSLVRHNEVSLIPIQNNSICLDNKSLALTSIKTNCEHRKENCNSPDNISSTEEDTICDMYKFKGYCWTPNCTKCHNIVGKNNENSDLCNFYVKHNYCWVPACTKVHRSKGI